MFSILNEIKDNSPASIMGVIGGSIGTAASIYILVAITGYFTFGDDVKGNIVGMYSSSVASTIAKAAIVILVTFSVPLQIHPCRASIDAVLRWRPSKSSSSRPSTASAPGAQPLLPSSVSAPAPAAAGLDSHGAPLGPVMSELRFALITSGILVLSYITALNVASLDLVLAYVGSTGSTAISFILPGLFYYKISDPESIHHQRLTKEDDDVDYSASDDDDGEPGPSGGGLLAESVGSLASIRSLASGGGISVRTRTRTRRGWLGRWRRKWRWDMEHIETGFLRKLALGLAIYGVCVMIVCLGMNTFFLMKE